MIRKEVVFNYLDKLFDGADKKIYPENNIRVYKFVKNGRTIFEMYRNREGKSIHFSNNEFFFINNMFGLSEDSTTDYIREYLVYNIDPEIVDIPIFPHM